MNICQVLIYISYCPYFVTAAEGKVDESQAVLAEVVTLKARKNEIEVNKINKFVTSKTICFQIICISTHIATIILIVISIVYL